VKRETIAKHQGRLELTWTDKDKTLLSSGDGRYDYPFVHPSDYRVSEILARRGRAHRRRDPIRSAQRPACPDGRQTLLITGDVMHAVRAWMEQLAEVVQELIDGVEGLAIEDLSQDDDSKGAVATATRVAEKTSANTTWAALQDALLKHRDRMCARNWSSWLFR
jgi:hypothetical protein